MRVGMLRWIRQIQRPPGELPSPQGDDRDVRSGGLAALTQTSSLDERWRLEFPSDARRVNVARRRCEETAPQAKEEAK